MARLIDADALEKYIADTFGYPAADILHEIATFPTVDAVPAVHGRWVPSTEEMEDGFGESHMIQTGVECSVCGQYSCCGGNFCKNCGARMDLKEESDA